MKKSHRKMHIFLTCLMFALYNVILFAILFRASRPSRELNLVPFHTIGNFLFTGRMKHIFAISNVFGNIILFIPMAIYFSLFNKGKRSVFLIFLISVLVEIVQYTFKLGTGDIDDVILNAFGGWIGVSFYKALRSKLKDENKVKQISEWIGAGMTFLILFLYLCI